jgi:putative transport protein
MLDTLLSNPFLVLFALMGVGLALGRVTVGGLNLGSSGVLFVAIVVGHFGYSIPAYIGTFGLVLFVYCVGIGAGGRFFSAIARQGSKLALLSVLVVGLGALTTYFGAILLGIPADISAGIFAGSLTSTPALAAATDVLKEQGSNVSIGYGIAYPFGVIGVVLFVQLLPRILRRDLDVEAKALEDKELAMSPIMTTTIKVTNPNLVGKTIAECELLSPFACQITRIVKDKKLVPLSYSDTYELGQLLLIVGRQNQIKSAVDVVGEVAPSEDQELYIDTDRERRQLIVLNNSFKGKSLRDLKLLKHYNTTVSRVDRLGFTFIPTMDTEIDRNDVLTVVGRQADLARLEKDLGHRSNKFDETDLLSLGCGLALGVIVGIIKITPPGGEAISLGLAGGPLIAGLVLGHFGRIGPIMAHIPRQTRMLLQELGLVLFLADAGIKGGRSMLETIQEYGTEIFLMGAVCTILPLIVSFIVGRYLLKINILEALGGICGGMTSTPALGAITAKTDSQFPVISYATAYPIAMILMTVFAKVLIQAIGMPGL